MASIPQSMKRLGRKQAASVTAMYMRAFILVQLVNVKDYAEVALRDPSVARGRIKDIIGYQIQNLANRHHSRATESPWGLTHFI